MKFTPTTPVGRIATEAPLSTRVFARHGIDFCCGGKRPLREACEEQGLAAERVLEEIAAESAPRAADERRWDDAPLPALIDHILARYHRPLDEELPRIEAMARKVFSVHGEKDPERLRGILDTFLGLRAELEGHFAKEEQILFPMIKAGQGRFAQGPVHVMEMEHDGAGAALRRLRTLTGDYAVPAEACNTWRALWAALEALESSLHEHIHLENNILFPRALGSVG